VIALLFGSLVVGGLVVGWCGYRTLNRIQRWGEKMNELDAVFRSAATAEEMAAYINPDPSGNDKTTPLPATHLPVGVPH
jgi:hypothetical protein